jgi:hypothetical protein
MAYSINKTDGTLLATVADGQVDNLSTDITLIGKNYSGFGESLNENFIKLLENFAGTSRPEHPIRGQIWFDASEAKLKVYTGTGFVPVSSATISNSQPGQPGAGDLWFNNISKQLYFYDGTGFILLGPAYSQSQGLSGFKVETILDSLNASRVVTYLYDNGVLLGIFSKDTFTPKLNIEGFSGSIIPGFNAGTLTGLKFNVTATNADKLDNVASSLYARRDQANNFAEPLIITNNSGLNVGAGTEGAFNISAGNVRLYNTASNKNLSFAVQKGVASETAVNIISPTREVKIYDGFTDSLTTVGGSLTVVGDLVVQGNTTTINTSVLTIEDKNVVLAATGDSSAGTDENADGGGIILRGTTDHEFLWNGPQTSWDSTEHINLVTGKAYKINGATVLSSTQCFSSSFPNLNDVGVLLQLTVDDVYVNNNRISSLQANQNLELEPNGTGNLVLIGSPLVTGLATTNDTNPIQTTENTGSIGTALGATELSEATNKKYVLNVVRTRSLAFSLDVSDFITDGDIAVILTSLAPVNEYENGTVARILCSRLTNLDSSATTSLAAPGTAEFVTPTGTAFAITSQAINSPITVPAQSISINRVVKTFILQAGVWTFSS